MTRTPARTRDLIAMAETESQRALARSVSCDDCGAKIDKPCRSRHGSELRAEHPRRLRRAERMRDRGEIECSFCQRLQLTIEQREVTAWPAELAWCADHRRVAEEVKEAREAER